MISYNWNSQELAKQINTSLTNAGIKTWIDIEGGMKDDIIESMAQGVDNASCIVALMSSAYNKSKNCSLEFKYASEKNIPIIPIMTESFNREGWLAILTAGALYIEIKNNNELNSKKAELVDRVKRFSGANGQVVKKSSAPSPSKPKNEWNLSDKYIKTQDGKALDVFMNLRVPGTQVIVWFPTNGVNQQWKFSMVDEKYMTIDLLNTNLVLNIRGYTPGEWVHGQMIIVWNKVVGAPGQLWRVQKHGSDADPSFSFHSKHNDGLALAINWLGQICVENFANGGHQKFKCSMG